MSGVQRPWLWSLPTRVELTEGASIEFKKHGQPGVRFKQSQIDKMFEVGLMQPPRTSERDPDSSAVGVTLEGDARFLVGEVDVGREVGMEVLVRGLKAAIDASYQEFRERHPRTEPDDDVEDSGPDESPFDEPDLLGLALEVTVPVDEAGARMGDLLDEVEHGAHVVFAEDGRRVTVMMSWPAYADLREKHAAMAAAFWTAWHNGVFDVAGYATDVTRILRRRAQAKPDRASDEDGDGRAAEGGDQDDETH